MKYYINCYLIIFGLYVRFPTCRASLNCHFNKTNISVFFTGNMYSLIVIMQFCKKLDIESLDKKN